MKRTISTLFFALLCIIASAQIQSIDGGMGAYRRIVKDEYGKADMLAYYNVKHLKDSTQVGKYSEAQCLLQISDNYICFSDYHQIVLDSLETILAHNKKVRTRENEGKWRNAAYKIGFPTKLIINLEEQNIRAQINTGLQDYEYVSPQPALDWNIVTGDTIINNVSCKKALCHYAGRNYIAWYTESIPQPYGPYIFQGLPGLIMEIRDTKNNWIFTNNGLCKASDTDVLYLYKKGFASGSVKVTTREKALDALRNETENRNNLITELAKVKVLKNGKWITPETNNPLEPSNLIELDLTEPIVSSTNIRKHNTGILSKIHELQEVVVSVEPIREQGDTLNYNVASFKKKEDQYIEDVIKRLPGIDVSTTGEITYQGKSINKLNIEGLDLMGDKYNQATRNMPTDAVSQIQIMENNQPVRALEGTVNTNHATINIKLKKDYKLKPFGEIEGGFGNDIWQGTATTINMTPKNQWLVTGTMDNRGISLSSLATEMANNDRMYTNEPLPKSIISNVATYQPPISPLYYLKNKSYFGGINYLHAFSEYSNIRFNLLYNHESEYRNDSIFNQFVANEPIKIWQNETLNKNTDVVKGQLRYELNSDNVYIENMSTDEYSWINSAGHYNTNFSNVDENVERKPAYIQNILNSHIKFGDKILTLSSVVRAFSAKEYLKDYYTEEEEDRQTTKLYSFFMRNRLGTYLPMFGKTLNIAYILEHKRNNLELIELSADNFSKYWLNTVELGYSIDFNGGELSLSFPIEHINFKMTDKHNKKFLIAPSANLNLKITNSLSGDFSLGYNQDYNASDIFYNNLICRNFRYYSIGIDTLSIVKANTANMRLSYLDTSNLLSMGLFLGWTSQERDYMLDYIYTDAFTLSKPKWRDNTLSTLSAAYNLKKIFRGIGMSINYSIQYANNKQMVSQNSIEGYIKNNVLSSKLSTTWDKIDILHISAAGGFNVHWKSHDIFSYDNNIQRDFECLLKADIFPLNKLHIYADYSQIYHEISSGNYAYFDFLNAGFKYTLSRNMTIKGSAINLLNHKYYKESIYQGVNYMYYEIPLRGREVLLALNIKF